jgi:hypothetical protein
MTSTKFSLRFFRDKRVNGRADLPDFFPVWLDLSEALARLDAMPGGGEIEIKLRHARDALAYVPTALSTNDAGAFLVAEVTGIASAATRKITADGVALPGVFADAVRADPSKGVILIEGRAATTEPLVLEIWRKGRKVLEKSLPLHVAPVEQMYARVNLRDGAAAVTPGSCLPPANGTNVVFLHGFNVTPEEARAWHSEMFKRLWQSGSKARFHAVTWRGDVGWPNALHYHEDVVSAFATAPHLKNYVNGLSGEKIMMAHSLGNMVVSSAIADHGMGVHKYFMFNAAVAAEAYDVSQWNGDDSGLNPMMHNDWTGYAGQTWSARWHELFLNNPGDDRAALTWKTYFSAVPSSILYNYHSSGDEVLELNNVAPSLSTGAGGLFNLFPTRKRYSWHKQEVFKGRDMAVGTSWAGWGFLRTAPESTYAQTLIYPDAATANQATPAQLADQPVFRWNPSGMLTNSIPAALRNELLAKGIPALSGATGTMSVSITDDSGNAIPGRNQDMNSVARPNGWPRLHAVYEDRWLHSDLKDVAFFYTFKLFENLVTTGVLK